MNEKKMIPVKLDLNNPIFQECLFELEKKEQLAVLNSLKKLAKLNWTQIYADSGLKWEVIYSKTGPHGQKLYSIRMGQAFRAIVCREGEFMRFLTLHPDHDSTYR